MKLGINICEGITEYKNMKLPFRYLTFVLVTLIALISLYNHFGGHVTHTRTKGADIQLYSIQEYSKEPRPNLSSEYVEKDPIQNDDRKPPNDSNDGQARIEGKKEFDTKSDKLKSSLNNEDEQSIARDIIHDKSNKLSNTSKVIEPKNSDHRQNTKNSTNKPWRTEYNKIVNPHNFHYKINEEDICASNTDIIVFIITATNHFTRRLLIRQAWAGEKMVNGFTIKVVFLVGDSGKLTMNLALQEESAIYGDIIQETFMDTYRNLTLKTIMGLKWVTNFCPDARYILKCDDDIFVNVFELVRHLKVYEMQGKDVKNLILCDIDTGDRATVIRDPSSKWYVTNKEYPGDHFPTYCDGPVYLLATNVGKALYNASLYQPLFWLEDVYTTGFLADKLGMKHKKFTSSYVAIPKWFTFNTFVSYITKHYVFVICESAQHIAELWLILKQYKMQEKRLLNQPNEVKNAAIAREKERFEKYNHYLGKLV
ncbi:unnamed protein product [Owenia fusiformis]|uniref:Hexosyltransferase n=1 Tax=Owenia fusiformis TaxID=6347 RepID=A0A8J1U2P8_OWEFU|nr:unnamed protein product [Owenia fusiformis]